MQPERTRDVKESLDICIIRSSPLGTIKYPINMWQTDPRGSLDVAGQDVHLSADHFKPEYEAAVRCMLASSQFVHAGSTLALSEAHPEPHISVQGLPSTVVWRQTKWRNFFNVVPCILITSRFFSPRTLHGTQYTHHSLKHMSPQHCKTYNDVFLLINSTKV